MPAEEPPLVDSRERIFLSGIVLAAGSSTRMGRPKQLLPLGGRSLLQRTLDEAAASCLDELILVLGHRSQEILEALRLPVRPPCRAVVNRRYPEGQSSSLVLGLRPTNPAARAAAILLGDQPFVTAALIDRVARDLLRARPDWIHELPLAGGPPVDIDTPEEWRRAQSQLLDSG